MTFTLKNVSKSLQLFSVYKLTCRVFFNQYCRLTLWVLLCSIVMLATAQADPRKKQISQAQTLRFGVLPDRSPETLKQRFNPLLRYIEQEMGITTVLVIPNSYEELVTQFQEKSVDLAFFGGYTFIQAKKTADAEAFVMRDIDLRFSTVFLTQSDNSEEDINSFKGARLGFGAKLSTSGHWMPRYFLSQRQINPEAFFGEVLYSGSHDTTAYWVRDGRIDLGAANSKVIKKMLIDGRLKKNDIHILWETPFYTDYVWAIQPDFNANLRDQLLDSFLALSLRDPKHQKILTAQGAGSFIPSNREDFEVLRNIFEAMEQQ